ncbi:tripartite ATP-independent transporter solute receptor, DctP family [Tistlia consotensis]|uniref:Tripartite ATP-independent transporter solute receptor, DctP family n=1 Tax=Tistlia consotensis USBA 355 TaxID=560819 RepID=A0A1Y6CAI5_9PROT|nr:sialic acid TRAP transporter substrate-binding protein SiaP [Tistlia consotensis]SMF45519.1 tripartite ATP-independent transporter solute receptor, DctP family [Tistlia consotensis USBA 355]SNR79757.1 tripartite ATP-independent transporter solute receptor, DctP family [Tistlia consotensis]
MTQFVTRRAFLASTAVAAAAASVAGRARPAFAADKVTLRLSSPATPTDQRAVALTEVFGPAVAGFASFEPHWNASLFKQGTELEAIARGNLEMSITSAQELATLFPEWSIFTAGYLHRDAEHQKKVFAAAFMDPMKQKVEEQLGVKLLTVMYLGRRQLNLRIEKHIETPADLAGVKLRMPGTDAWQFLGRALGANPVPMAFTEVYTGLQTGAIDGQDNPLPTDKDSKFYEVTRQIVLTSHLVDLNYLAFSKQVWDGLSAEQRATVQKAADDAAELGRKRQLKLEDELAQFFKDQGLKVYEPNVEAFRKHVQKAYLESDFAKDWPKGMVDQINAL